MSVQDFRDFCFERHDKVCNQKYDDYLPYSFHLKAAERVGYQFKHLLPENIVSDFPPVDENFTVAMMGIYGHDLIEDARMTYNEIKDRWGVAVAEVIYYCTEMRGKTRDHRKNDEFFEELSKDDIAVFVKLCDIIANASYSLFTMDWKRLKKSEEEYHAKVKKYLYNERYKPMFDFLEQIYASKI